MLICAVNQLYKLKDIEELNFEDFNGQKKFN
jgi:hypothetical protein